MDTIYAPSMPWGQNIGLVARFTFTRNESGRPHRLEVIVQDTDGATTAKIEGTVGAEWMEDLPPGWPVGALVALNFGIPLPNYGLYSVEILLNDSSVKSLNLRVIPPPQA